MSILVLAEITAGALSPLTRSAVTAARQLGEDVHLLVAGSNTGEIAKKATQIDGINIVLVADAPFLAQGLAENMAPLVAGLSGYTHVLAAASSFGKDVLPRIAGLLDVQQVSDVIKVYDTETYLHPIYAGNALETVCSGDAVKLLTIRPTAFDKAGDGGAAEIRAVPTPLDAGLSIFLNVQSTVSARPELTSARIVVSGGRGLGSKDNFRLLEAIADKLGGALGASRAAVDAGYVPNDYQVGQTGKVVAPELYLAVGISGAIQHLAGMKDSKVIVAINKDESAPIFEIADYGLVGDLFEILPKLEALL